MGVKLIDSTNAVLHHVAKVVKNAIVMTHNGEVDNDTINFIIRMLDSILSQTK